MTDFRPTRTCPHRLCRPLHTIAAIAALMIVTALAPIQPWIIGVVLIGGLFSIGIYRLVHKQTSTDTVLEQVEETVTVIARPNWARAAAASDAVMAVFVVTVLAVFTMMPSGDWGASAEGPSVPGIATAVAWMLLSEVLHRRAALVRPKQGSV